MADDSEIKLVSMDLNKPAPTLSERVDAFDP
jgi:hypothetical protein